MQTIEEDLEERISNRLINKKLEPIKCPHCSGTNLKDKPTDIHGGAVCESVMICIPCDKIIGHWAYGGWMP